MPTVDAEGDTHTAASASASTVAFDKATPAGGPVMATVPEP